MSLKLTAESYLSGVRRSGLVEAAELDALLERFRVDGIDLADATQISDALVEAGAITPWQAGKLAQGKHKGFTLGRYRLQSLLGRGEMSAVYLAQHIRMNRRCAIKVLPAHKVRNTSYLERFHREAQAVASLDHPNIVRAYDVDQVEEGGVEIHFLVMEYVDGSSLEQLLQKRGEFGVVEAVEYIRQAAAGLGHAHEAGLVHRDVKPANLLVDTKGIVRLLDLGLAKFFKEEETESLTIKHDEKVLGTADYLAPEQAVDSHEVDTRADVYSLGCTLYFALTGRPPFNEETLVQRLLAHQTKKPTPVTDLRPDVPASLAAILDRLMAKPRDERPDDATAVSRELSKWLVTHGGDSWRSEHAAQVVELGGSAALASNERPAEAATNERKGDTSGEVAPATVPSASRRSEQVRATRTGETRSGRPSREPGGSAKRPRRLPSGRPVDASRRRRTAAAESSAGRPPVVRNETVGESALWQRVVIAVVVIAVTALGIQQLVNQVGGNEADRTTAASEID